MRAFALMRAPEDLEATFRSSPFYVRNQTAIETLRSATPAGLATRYRSPGHRSWESSPGVHRFFAGCCGSPIFKRDDAAAEILGFRLGTLDADPGRKADLHFMVRSKVPWLDIHDSLPRTEGADPEFGERD